MNAIGTAPVLHQRSQGAAHVALRRGAGRTRPWRIAQSGSARVVLLEGETEPEVVFLNTSGGLTGGDRLEIGVELGPRGRAVATTQTAERAYRAGIGRARVTVRHAVGAGGHLDWLPQETILFEDSALERRTTIALEGDASCLTLESVVLGRRAMGERVTTLHLTDRREITRDGRPVLVEPLALGTGALGAGPAVLEGTRAFASLVMVAPGAGDALAPVRGELDEPGVTGGASAFDGKLVVRLAAADGWPLRRQVARLLLRLRRAALPRVWQMAGGEP